MQLFCHIRVCLFSLDKGVCQIALARHTRFMHLVICNYLVFIRYIQMYTIGRDTVAENQPDNEIWYYSLLNAIDFKRKYLTNVDVYFRK